MSRIAIVGTGIAGMGCAHFLHRDHEITVFEQNHHVGGHTNTVTATEPGTRRAVPVDTGFMVYNEVTYPLLTRLFRELRVPVKKTDMSFSVRHAGSGLEYCGSSLNHLFAQRRNVLRLSHWRMLAAIDRFNREAVDALEDPAVARMTLAEYVRRRRYGSDFLSLYLEPMSSAVWSTPPEKMGRFPATTLLRFFHNHGFLGLHTQHQWLTVDGGAREYRDRLIAPWGHTIRTGCPVVGIHRGFSAVTLHTGSGAALEFDKVIVAIHGDQALRLLRDATPEERRLLGAFKYQQSTATLHTDASVMPRTRRAWASWNHEINRDATGRASTATHYWMNKLQGVSDVENYFVTLDRPQAIDPARVLKRIAYEHPLFDLDAVSAQPELPVLNRSSGESTETYFAGSYFRHGFHEDAFKSAVDLAEQILARDPWKRAPESEARETALIAMENAR